MSDTRPNAVSMPATTACTSTSVRRSIPSGLEFTFRRKPVVEVVSVNAAALLVAVVRAAGNLRIPTIRGGFGTPRS